MKIPKEFKLGSITYKVKIIKNTDSDGIMEEGVFGYYNAMEQTIILRGDAENPDVMEHTFIHEFWHAVFDFISFQKAMVKETADKDHPMDDAFYLEETIVDDIAKVTKDFLTIS